MECISKIPNYCLDFWRLGVWTGCWEWSVLSNLLGFRFVLGTASNIVLQQSLESRYFICTAETLSSGGATEVMYMCSIPSSAFTKCFLFLSGA